MKNKVCLFTKNSNFAILTQKKTFKFGGFIVRIAQLLFFFIPLSILK